MFVHNFERMSLKQRRVMLKNFLLPFLSKPQSGLSWTDQSQSCFHIRFIIQSKYLLFISSNSRSRLRERIQFQYRVVDEEPRPVLHHVVPGTTAGPQPTLWSCKNPIKNKTKFYFICGSHVILFFLRWRLWRSWLRLSVLRSWLFPTFRTRSTSSINCLITWPSLHSSTKSQSSCSTSWCSSHRWVLTLI